jgi:hypothetical protein
VRSNAPSWKSSVVTKNNKSPAWGEKTTFHCDSLKNVVFLVAVYDHNDLLVHLFHLSLNRFYDFLISF